MEWVAALSRNTHIVALMLVYPPFQVVTYNGIVFNMGYSWIFEPPKKGQIGASVNASMLIIQWVGVLIIGGLTCFLAKTSLEAPHSSSVATSSESSNHSPQEPNDENHLMLEVSMNNEKK